MPAKGGHEIRLRMCASLCWAPRRVRPSWRGCHTHGTLPAMAMSPQPSAPVLCGSVSATLASPPLPSPLPSPPRTSTPKHKTLCLSPEVPRSMTLQCRRAGTAHHLRTAAVCMLSFIPRWKEINQIKALSERGVGGRILIAPSCTTVKYKVAHFHHYGMSLLYRRYPTLCSFLITPQTV